MTLKRSKFRQAQVALILRQADEGTSVGEVWSAAGISEATFYVWRKKYAGLMSSEMKRPRQIEDEKRLAQADCGGPLARQGEAAG